MLPFDTIKVREYAKGSGCTSSFWLVTWNGLKGVGLKRYHDARTAVHCMAVQDELARHGLAPKVLGGLVKVYHVGDQDVGWGYLTEVAKCLREERTNTYEKLGRVREEIKSRIASLFGFDDHCFDDHEGNWCLLGDRLVMIDMDDPMFMALRRERERRAAA